MCGIAGVFTKQPIGTDASLLKQMSEAIAHRGPDSTGIYQEAHISFAHNRLAILDTSDKGAQPMTSKDGRWVIIFNGCIYNFKELRQELISRGHTFISDCDTEVIVEGLSAFGPSVFEQYNGMFAIAAWDKHTQQLYLSRDRYGIKPLYYWFQDGLCVFASEIKAILKHPAYRMKMNYGALNEYFTFQNIFTYRTLFDGISMLPPANTIAITTSTTHIVHQSWWDYDFSQPDEHMSFQEAKEETARLLEQAVRRQLVADVPVGSYLSGGLDSSSITAIAARTIPQLHTFTCGFDMSQVTGKEMNSDERQAARIMAEHVGTTHHEQVIVAGDIKRSLPSVVSHIEDIRMGMSYPNYYIARLASQVVKVCLQGTGGDELFGGYPWRYYQVFDSLSKQEFFDHYYTYWQRLVKDEDKQRLFTPATFAQINIDEPKKLFERVFLFNPKLEYTRPEDYIQNSLYFEIKTFLPGLLLVGDKLSMAHALEERFPFLDNDLVNFAQKIPVRHKLGNLTREIKRIDENIERKKFVYQEYTDGKNVLRQAMEQYMPEELRQRKKQGFSSPDESWYRGENAAYVKEMLLDANTASSAFINHDYVKKIVTDHIEKKQNNRLLIWSLLNFESWCRIFFH